jgi:hypothetical protein
MSVAMDNEFPGLSHFFGAYMNQDYDLTADSLEGVLACYVQENPDAVVAGLRADAARFLQEKAANLDGEFREQYGFDFDPASWGYTTKSFLEWLLANAHR